MITVDVPFPAVPQPRPKFRTFGKGCVSAYYPKNFQQYQQQLGALLATHNPPLLAGPVGFSARFLVPLPKKSKYAIPRTHDADNLVKAVLDVLNHDGRWWEDDSQILHLTVAKRLVPHDVPGSFSFTVWELENGDF